MYGTRVREGMGRVKTEPALREGDLDKVKSWAVRTVRNVAGSLRREIDLRMKVLNDCRNAKKSHLLGVCWA